MRVVDNRGKSILPSRVTRFEQIDRFLHILILLVTSKDYAILTRYITYFKFMHRGCGWNSNLIIDAQFADPIFEVIKLLSSKRRISGRAGRRIGLIGIIGNIVKRINKIADRLAAIVKDIGSIILSV